MQFSINLDTVFAGVPAMDAFASMREAGLSTFERWRIAEDEIAPLRMAMRAFGMRMSACCTNEFVLTDLASHDAYEAGLRSALNTLFALGCRQLITQVGQDTGAARDAQHDAIVEGLRRVAPLLEARGVTLLVEPLNDVKDHPGYYLTDSREGFEIIREVGSENVRLLYDIYHQLHMGEDIMDRIAENLDLIGHFHVAGHPGRDEQIFTGYDYGPFFDYMQAQDTDAHVGIELMPTEAGKVPELLMALRAFA